jgi:hypothetical protein
MLGTGHLSPDGMQHLPARARWDAGNARRSAGLCNRASRRSGRGPGGRRDGQRQEGSTRSGEASLAQGAPEDGVVAFFHPAFGQDLSARNCPAVRDLESWLPGSQIDDGSPERADEDVTLLPASYAQASAEPEEASRDDYRAGLFEHLAAQRLLPDLISVRPPSGQLPVLAVAADHHDPALIGQADPACSVRRSHRWPWGRMPRHQPVLVIRSDSDRKTVVPRKYGHNCNCPSSSAVARSGLPSGALLAGADHRDWAGERTAAGT